MTNTVNAPKLIDVLRLAWSRGFSTKSDYARAHANLVALAASRGLITTRLDRETYGTRWLISPDGLSRIWAFKKGITS
jgi:hypothetical protein